MFALKGTQSGALDLFLCLMQMRLLSLSCCVAAEALSNSLTCQITCRVSFGPQVFTRGVCLMALCASSDRSKKQ